MKFPEIDPPHQIELAPGDILGLITDGVFERENPAGTMFGTAGVEQVLRTRHEGSMSDLLARLLQAVHVFADGHPQGDDITIVLLARRGETAGRTTIQRYFPRSLDSLDGMFRFVGDFIAARSLDAELHMPVCFIVEELFTNFIKYNAASPHDISLSLGHTPEQLTVRITDFDVDSFDVTHAPAVDTTSRSPSASRAGWVCTWCSRWRPRSSTSTRSVAARSRLPRHSRQGETGCSRFEWASRAKSS